MADTVCFELGYQFWITTTVVVNQDALVPRGDMVRMNPVNGQVIRWRVVGGVPEQVACFNHVAFRCEQEVTSTNVLGFLPRIVGDVPELVILSRRLSRRPYSSLNLKPACSVIGQN